MKNGRTMFLLFLSYILLVVPMFICGGLVTEAMMTGVRFQLDQRIDSEILQIEQQLNNQMALYKENAVILSLIDELTPDKFRARDSAMKKGITYLSNVMMLDTYLNDIFLCYREEIFLPEGYCLPDTYLKSTLGCSEEIATLGNRILQDDEEKIAYLPVRNSGYLLYHYPMHNDWKYNSGSYVNSINYCIRINNIYVFLESMMEQMDYTVHLVFENEWQTEVVYLTGNPETKIHEITETEYQTLEQSRRWVSREVVLDEWGMRFQISYDSGQVYQQVHFWQVINMVSMGILLLIAMLVSYGISSNHYRKIRRLREALQEIYLPREREKEISKNEFDYMHSMIGSIAQETEAMRERNNSAMRQQGAMLLFYGCIQEEKTILDMLSHYGQELQKPFFTVLCITPTKREKALPDAIERLVEKRLGFTGIVAGRRAVVLLVELPDQDDMRVHRMEFAETVLRDTGRMVKIAFSRTYENLLQVSDAYLEAADISKRLQQTEEMYFDFADDYSAAKGGVKEAGESQVRTEQEAEEETDAKEGASAERAGTVLSAGQQECDGTEKAITAEEADGEDEEKKRIDFAKVIEYIKKNYCRYDLSREEVAKYAGLSNAYMSRLFKEKTGSKYIEYLTACRMEEAKRLLLETNMSIKDIAEAVGYFNVPGFRNKFKSYFGINASEIRKKYRNSSVEEQGEE